MKKFKILVTKSKILTLVFMCGYLVNNGQIVELDVVNNIIPDNLSGIELARASYLKGEYLKAEALLFVELEKGTFDPSDYLQFANTLNMDNKPSLAKEFYKEYNARTVNKSKEVLAPKNTNFTSRIITTRQPITNPTSYNGVVYSELSTKVMSYTPDCEGNLTSQKESLKGITNIPFGSVSLFNNGQNAIASLIDEASNTSSLYYFYQKKGKWKKPIKLFSETDGQYAFPYVDEQNNTLYFSSNKEGGYGGYDLYKCIFIDKSFEKPINMGKDVNTFGHEINPTKSSNWLYFSSNGHVSNGGYDIYKYSSLSDQNILSNCTAFNSKENELAIVLVNNKVIVSREYKDLFSLNLIEKTPYESLVTGSVVDKNNNSVQGAYILLSSSNGSGFHTRTDQSGSFSLKMLNKTNVMTGKVVAEGYESTSFDLSSPEVSTIVLTQVKPVEIVKEVEKIVYRDQPDVITSSIVTNDNSENDLSPVEIPTPLVYDDTKDNKPNSPDRGLLYIIIGSTSDYAEAYSFWTKWMPTFAGAEILDYGNNLYRIGFYAGADENQAMASFNKAKKLKTNVWILRPKN